MNFKTKMATVGDWHKIVDCNKIWTDWGHPMCMKTGLPCWVCASASPENCPLGKKRINGEGEVKWQE